MEHEFLSGFYTIAAGVVLYSGKELVRFFVDNKLNRKQSNLENIYPIYVEVFKAAKIFIGSYNTPLSQPESLKALKDETLEQFKRNRKFIKAYKNNVSYRYIINLNFHVDSMRETKQMFNNLFSANQFCFNEDFVRKTIYICEVMDKDMDNLQSKLNYCGLNNVLDPESYIIDESYKEQINVYEQYLDEFHKQFKKRFKI